MKPVLTLTMYNYPYSLTSKKIFAGPNYDREKDVMYMEHKYRRISCILLIARKCRLVNCLSMLC